MTKKFLLLRQRDLREAIRLADHVEAVAEAFQLLAKVPAIAANGAILEGAMRHPQSGLRTSAMPRRNQVVAGTRRNRHQRRFEPHLLWPIAVA